MSLLWNIGFLGGSTARVNHRNYKAFFTTIATMLYLLYIPQMRYSTSDLSRKSGDIIARALQGPITITQRGKPRLILMSVEEYNRLRGKVEDRKPAADPS